MKLYSPNVVSLVLFSGILIISCSKSDPAPLGAQTNAKFLAGDAGKSKTWKLVQVTIQAGSGSAQQIPYPACFTDNLYTFTNNASQDYTATEGASVCTTGYPSTIESGSWAFTIDGLTVLIEVDQTFSDNGLFSPESALGTDANGNYYANPIGFPYPAAVQTLTSSSMILVMNNTVGTSTYTFILNFVPA